MSMFIVHVVDFEIKYCLKFKEFILISDIIFEIDKKATIRNRQTEKGIASQTE